MTNVPSRADGSKHRALAEFDIDYTCSWPTGWEDDLVPSPVVYACARFRSGAPEIVGRAEVTQPRLAG